MPTLHVPKAAFNACYLPHLEARQRTQIFYGGAGSGKSVFLSMRVVLDALCGRNTLVVRQVARSLRASCFTEVQKSIHRLGLADFFIVLKTEMTITCKVNGAQLLFLGLDDVEKIKSITPIKGVLTDIWVEEATQASQHDIKQLEKRLRGESAHRKRLTLSFNPVSIGHWLYKAYFSDFDEGKGLLCQEDLLILRTTYRDNRFLSQDDRLALENERDAYFHSVYTQGQWGSLGGAVLTRWRVGDLPQGLDAAPLRCGLDFGFSSDPAAFVLAQYDKKHGRVYVMKEFLQAGLTNDLLARKLRELAPGCLVACDSAEPKSIMELRRHGIQAVPAKKGPDSVLHGLQWLMQQELVLHPSCKQLREELLGYCWQQDEHGLSLPRPLGEDHLIDALRYALEMDSTAQEARVLRR